MNNFIFVQYTAGACGRAIGVCLQTAETVKSWDLPDINAVVNMHTNDHSHVRHEPDSEYKLAWLARTHGIIRGDDLARHEVIEKLKDEDLLNKGQLIIPWTKAEMPSWFSDTLVQIINDRSSFDWLIARRKKLFYMKRKQGTIEVRYDSRYHTRPDRNDRCVNELDIDSLAFLQTHAETYPINPVAYQIPLSQIITKKWDQVLDILEQATGSPLDRVWCTEYLTAWHKQISR